MKAYILFALGLFVNYSQSTTAMPVKKVLFPSESDESDEIFSYNSWITAEQKTIANGYVSAVKPSPNIRFRIDAANVPCSNATLRFCERVDQHQYPTQHINNVLQQNAERYANFFNNISTRNDFPEPINLCDTYTRQIFPQIAMNVDSDWRFIINQPKFRQTIRIELCQKRSSQCQFGELFPTGYV